MEVHLDSEKEALLAEIAAQRKIAEELARLALNSYLEDDARFTKR